MNSTDNQFSYYFNICGYANKKCLPNFPERYVYGAAVQTTNFDTPPACNLANGTGTCLNRLTNQSECCTAACEVLGTGTPIWFVARLPGCMCRPPRPDSLASGLSDSAHLPPHCCRQLTDPGNPLTGGVLLTYYGVPPAAGAPFTCGNDANGASSNLQAR